MRDVTPESVAKTEKQKTDYIDHLLKVLPEPLASSYQNLPEGWLNQSEVTIRTLLNPTAQQEAIRTRIWQLVHDRNKEQEPRRIQLSEVAQGIAPLSYVSKVLEIPAMVAWCGVPTMDYDTRIEAMLDKAYARMKEILDMPIIDPETLKIDKTAAGLILQVAKMVDLRSRGNYTERIESKTLQVNATAKDAAGMLGLKPNATIEEIEAQIKLLESGGTKVVDDVARAE